jgi:hypothetical protein
MGFEETETIGPDGKPHIISEKTFNPSGPQPKLTKAQKAQQKAMQKEMQVLFLSIIAAAAASAAAATIPDARLLLATGPLVLHRQRLPSRGASGVVRVAD